METDILRLQMCRVIAKVLEKLYTVITRMSDEKIYKKTGFLSVNSVQPGRKKEKRDFGRGRQNIV